MTRLVFILWLSLFLFQCDVTGNSSTQQSMVPPTIDEETPNVTTTGNGDAAAHHAPMLQVLLLQ